MVPRECRPLVAGATRWQGVWRRCWWGVGCGLLFTALGIGGSAEAEPPAPGPAATQPAAQVSSVEGSLPAKWRPSPDLDRVLRLWLDGRRDEAQAALLALAESADPVARLRLFHIREDEVMQMTEAERELCMEIIFEKFEDFRRFSRELMDRVKEEYGKTKDAKAAQRIYLALRRLGEANTGPEVTAHADLCGQACRNVAERAYSDMQVARAFETAARRPPEKQPAPPSADGPLAELLKPSPELESVLVLFHQGKHEQGREAFLKLAEGPDAPRRLRLYRATEADISALSEADRRQWRETAYTKISELRRFWWGIEELTREEHRQTGDAAAARRAYLALLRLGQANSGPEVSAALDSCGRACIRKAQRALEELNAPPPATDQPPPAK